MNVQIRFGGLFAYLFVGILFQLLFYGNGPFDDLWTWAHILGWWLFVLFYFFWWGLIAVIVIGIIAFIVTRFT